MKQSKNYKCVGGKNYYNKISLKPNDRFIELDVDDILLMLVEDI